MTSTAMPGAKQRQFLQQVSKLIGLVGLLAACNSGDRSPSTSLEVNKTMKLTSNTFDAQGVLPAKYTCDGENISPALNWDTPPAGTRSLVLMVEDPDAPGGDFVHWIVYDLPPDLRQLPEGVPAQPILNKGGVQAKSDFGHYGYGGPCPPSGSHRYFFKLYALDTLLDLPPGATKAEITKTMTGHVLAEAKLMGRYTRQR